MKRDFIDWYIDPSYSRMQTIYRNGFAMCVCPSDDQRGWFAQGYDEHNGAFATGKTIYESKVFVSQDAAKRDAEREIMKLIRHEERQ